MLINYVVGDATYPQGDGNQIIVHICNDLGVWGAGFVLAVSARWPQVEAAYKAMVRAYRPRRLPLGSVQFCHVEPTIWVANLVGQTGVGWTSGPPIRYGAVREGLAQLGLAARRLVASVHMPRIGCGLAGGTWDRIEPLIQAELLDRGVAVTVYDLPSKR